MKRANANGMECERPPLLGQPESRPKKAKGCTVKGYCGAFLHSLVRLARNKRGFVSSNGLERSRGASEGEHRRYSEGTYVMLSAVGFVRRELYRRHGSYTNVGYGNCKICDRQSLSKLHLPSKRQTDLNAVCEGHCISFFTNEKTLALKRCCNETGAKVACHDRSETY